METWEPNFAVPGTMLEKEKEHDQVMNNLNQNIEQTHFQINGKPKVMVVKVLKLLYFDEKSYKTINAAKNNHILVVIDEIWALVKGPLSGAEILKEALPFFAK